jgi:hypothetical protein
MPKKNVLFSLTLQAQGPSAIADAPSSAFTTAVADTLSNVSVLAHKGVLSDDVGVSSVETSSNSTVYLWTDLYTSELHLDGVNASLYDLLYQNLSDAFNAFYDGGATSYFALVDINGNVIESSSSATSTVQEVTQFFDSSVGIGVSCAAAVLVLVLACWFYRICAHARLLPKPTIPHTDVTHADRPPKATNTPTSTATSKNTDFEFNPSPRHSSGYARVPQVESLHDGHGGYDDEDAKRSPVDELEMVSV